MPNIGLNIEHIKHDAPNAWLDIVNCYHKNTEGFEKNQDSTFEKLPFLLQIGIFKQYFSENGIDIDLNNQTNEELAKTITLLIIEHENTLKHYS